MKRDPLAEHRKIDLQFARALVGGVLTPSPSYVSPKVVKSEDAKPKRDQPEDGRQL